MARTVVPNYLVTEFNKILSKKYFSEELELVRKKAFDSFIDIGLPNRNLEGWRHTNLSSIKKNDFRVTEINDGPKEKIDPSQYGFGSFHTIVMYNGHFQQNLSSLPKGIELLSNLEYLKQKDWAISQPDKSPFDLLNTAFMDNGICIVVGQGIEITVPLRILFISSSDQKLMTSPRVYIDLKHSSSITLLEQHVGERSGHLLNESMIINIDDNARLDHVRIQNNSKTTINMGNLHVKQQRDSNYTFVQFAKGGELGRMNIFADLAGEGASSSINGLSLSNNSQHLDVNIVTNHHAPNCNSGQNFKSILKDHSSGVFNGRTVVHNGAEKTDSNQSNKNLLLSKNALMNSNPQLEIYTDDVKCSHGSTTGALEEDALFYIRSRGIDTESATSLLVHGFASEIIETVENDKIRDQIIKYFNKWLENHN
tara:strand:- start:1568 stop:2842 length:1275 start_codon:yes stop_codon:yes gene_type:complete